MQIGEKCVHNGQECLIIARDGDTLTVELPNGKTTTVSSTSVAPAMPQEKCGPGNGYPDGVTQAQCDGNEPMTAQKGALGTVASGATGDTGAGDPTAPPAAGSEGEEPSST